MARLITLTPNKTYATPEEAESSAQEWRDLNCNVKNRRLEYRAVHEGQA